MKIAHIPVAAVAVAALGATGYVTLHQKTSATAAPSQPAARPTAAARPISVELSDFAVTLSTARAQAGKVTFRVRNTGKIEHELVVLRTTKPAAGLGKGARIKEVVHVGEVAGLRKGVVKTLTLSLKRGHYSLVCNLPGHYMAGMHSDLRVS